MNSCYLNTSILKYDVTLPDPSFGSDALIIDLEDGVHYRQKEIARNLLSTIDLSKLRKDLIVGIRINQLRTIEGIKDLSAIYTLLEEKKININFIQIPKVQSSYDVSFCRSIFEKLPQKIHLIPIIETSDAINDVEKIASKSDAMMFGQVDMQASMLKINTAFMKYARGRFCVACFQENIPAIDTAVFKEEEDIRNINLFEEKCLEGKAEGFVAIAVVHPSQIKVARKIFAIDQAELKKYQSVIDLYDKAENGFSIVDGKIIAPPFVAHAESILKILS